MRLTQDKIDKLECAPGKRDQLVFDDVQRGLAVRVMASGSKSYLVQWTQHGRKRRLPVANCDEISLAQARGAAKAILGDVAMGKDPVLERKQATEQARAEAEKNQLTLGVLVEQWRHLHLTGRRVRYATEAIRALRRAFEPQWNRPAESLQRSRVVQILDHLPAAMASRTAAYGRACFAWGEKRGSVPSNPFENLPARGGSPARDRVLTDAELAAIWRAAEADPSLYGAIVRVLILTGQRREEVAGMAWAEISPDFSVWTIPAERTKNGEAHMVALSDPVRTVLQKTPRNGKLVFAGPAGTPFNGWSKAKNRLDEAAGVTDWRVHDLRRTVATGLQRLGTRLEVTEAVLNHVSGSRAGIVGIYQRHDWADEKRTALDAWARRLDALLSGAEQASNVVRLAG